MTKRVNYSVYPSYILRVPSLTLEKINHIPEERKDIDSFIRDQWSNPLVRNAILLASADLETMISEHINDKEQFPESVINSFLNYFTRFCTRSTPFGLFAGIVSGILIKDQKINIDINPPEEGQLACRLDMEYLVRQVHDLSVHKGIRESLIYSPSSSLYHLGTDIRFISSKWDEAGSKSYGIESIENHPLILPLLEFCRQGKIYSDLLSFFIEKDYSRSEAVQFIDELIDIQILVSSLEPVLTGMEYGKYLKLNLSKNAETNKALSRLISQIQELEDSIRPSQFQKINFAVRKLIEKTPLSNNNNKLIQGDFLRTAKSNQIPESLSNKIILGIRILKALGKRESVDDLGDFKSHFRRRFGTRQVPVLEVMDQEFGIGIDGPWAQQNSDISGLLDDLKNFGRPKQKVKENKKNFSLKGSSSDMGDNYFTEISSSEFSDIHLQEGEWPKQMYAICSLIGASDNPDIYIQHAAQGNPAYLLGRFGHLDDRGIDLMIKNCIRDEILNKPDEIFADIIHLPENRTGNILQRPSYYHYEIPLQAQSIIADEFRIELKDILVTVENDIVILQHTLSGKIINPRLNNAHNYSKNQLLVYEFLVRCGKQSDKGSYILPEQLNVKIGFTPGLRYQDLIFRMPQWNIQLTELKIGIPNELARRARYIQQWALRNKMPDKVILKEGDRHLYVNWKNLNLLECFWQTVKNKNIALFELYPYSHGSPVKENGSSLANQLILCWHQTK